MVKLRLTRMGKKKKPFYRIVAADSRVQRDGRWLEQLGFYNPMVDPYELELNLERVEHWLSHGAQPTDTVARLIDQARTGEPPKAKAKPEPKVEAAPAEEPAAEEVAEAPETEAPEASDEAAEA